MGGFNMECEEECESSLLCGEVAWDDDDQVASSTFEYTDFNNHQGFRHTDQGILSPDFSLYDDHDDALLSLSLFDKEMDHLPQYDYLDKYRNHTLDATARRDAITWILKVQAHYNFRPLTTYLCVNYLDRFLSIHDISQGTTWLLQLLSVACVSLAAKMEETQVPLISDLQVGDARLIFEAKTIKRMELMVMSQLKWRLKSITPLSFIDFYLYRLKLDKPVLRTILNRTTDLVINTIRVIDFLGHKPSAIAGAAVLCAVEELFPLTSALYKANLLCIVYIDKESITSCYHLMQELLIDGCSTPKKNGVGAVPSSPVAVLDAGCISYDSAENTGDCLPCTKRRKIVCDPLLYITSDNGW